MAYMIRITESKVEKLADKVGKALRYMGEAMTCIDKMQQGDESEDMGERSYMGDYRSMGMRGGYRGGYREPFRDEDYDRYEMGERRGVAGTGRYGRY